MERYKPLLKRAGELGANARRAIYNLQQHLDPLMERLEREGKLEEVQLWHISPRLDREFASLAQLGGDGQERLADLGCFFSLQLLHLNLYSLDLLRFQVNTRRNRLNAYREFLAHAGCGFEKLVGSYFAGLADHFFGRDKRPLFSVFAVGTPYNQGDIELGVVDDGTPARTNLQRVLSRIKPEMLRRAPAIRFSASENVGAGTYSASLEQFRELLAHRLQDFNLLRAMLCCRLLAGSRQLFDDFQNRITRQYLFDPDRSCRHHEAFLRGILGEIRARRLRPYRESEINLYEDGLLLARNLAAALRCVYGIKESNLPAFFAQLKKKDRGLAQIGRAHV
jgi:hypothetical protein